MDLVDGDVPTACDHDSGDTFPIGETAGDLLGHRRCRQHGRRAFTITVDDTTAPDVSVPALGLLRGDRTGGAPVAFAAGADDLVDGDLATACDHDSGETFPMG